MYCRRRVSGITFIKYAQDRRTGKPYNLTIFGSYKIKEPNARISLKYGYGWRSTPINQSMCLIKSCQNLDLKVYMEITLEKTEVTNQEWKIQIHWQYWAHKTQEHNTENQDDEQNGPNQQSGVNPSATEWTNIKISFQLTELWGHIFIKFIW